MRFFLADAQATQRLGEKLAQILRPGAIIFLRGDLGAGKTTLVQGIGLGLGIVEPIVSPTFTLICEYQEGGLPLYHLDLYRLEGRDLSGLYLENYWQGLEVPLGITVIEWPERLQEKPPHYLEIELRYLAGEGREAILQPRGNFHIGNWQDFCNYL